MTTWWHAVCDEHRCGCTVQITYSGNGDKISSLMENGTEQAVKAVKWLHEHYGCKLRLMQEFPDGDPSDDYFEHTHAEPGDKCRWCDRPDEERV